MRINSHIRALPSRAALQLRQHCEIKLHQPLLVVCTFPGAFLLISQWLWCVCVVQAMSEPMAGWCNYAAAAVRKLQGKHHQQQ